MTLQIDLTPEEEAWLRERAARLGLAPRDLARQILRSQMPLPESAPEQELLPVLDERGVFHEDRWEAVLGSMSRRAGKTPVLAPEALTREAWYQDHD